MRRKSRATPCWRVSRWTQDSTACDLIRASLISCDVSGCRSSTNWSSLIRERHGEQELRKLTACATQDEPSRRNESGPLRNPLEDWRRRNGRSDNHALLSNLGLLNLNLC